MLRCVTLSNWLTGALLAKHAVEVPLNFRLWRLGVVSMMQRHQLAVEIMLRCVTLWETAEEGSLDWQCSQRVPLNSLMRLPTSRAEQRHQLAV
jgi:hypothetical protein